MKHPEFYKRDAKGNIAYPSIGMTSLPLLQQRAIASDMTDVLSTGFVHLTWMVFAAT